jgi:organic radical activating enzyme
MKNGIIMFFYVDDIVFAYRKHQTDIVRGLVDQLQQKYTLTGGEPLQWFLGIEILRDREKKLIWLSQSSYIDKIANLAETVQSSSTPMSKEELLPNEDIASHKEIMKYQRKIGSLLYTAVITRPDVAFAVSRLSRFMTNPGPKHHEGADRVLHYLKGTRSLALQYGQDDHFRVASDASFADNSIDRKSSQAYAMKLFGGLIGWRASKQETVTTSTTEAELLALSQASKEALFVSRLIKELKIKLDDNHIHIECDNKQTIRLVTEEIATLQTKLRHVDIHNHWLRQEV